MNREPAELLKPGADPLLHAPPWPGLERGRAVDDPVSGRRGRRTRSGWPCHSGSGQGSTVTATFNGFAMSR